MRISDWSSDVCSSDLGRRLADALQAADEGDVDGDQVAGATGLDVALAELAAEALQETDLLVAEGDLALGGGRHLVGVEPGPGVARVAVDGGLQERSEEHTSELQSLMRISYAVFCLKQKK